MRAIECFLDGRWAPGEGPDSITGHNPSTGEPLPPWREASRSQVDAAIAAARRALPAWSRRPVEDRAAALDAFARAVEAQAPALTEALVDEAGKPPWEAAGEVRAVVGKVALTLQAWSRRCAEFGQGADRTRFKAHGAVGILGPFNMPAHLPNGQIVPALLAGNTVVFKPSERTPATAALLTACWEMAGLPEGVFNLLPGGPRVGEWIASHEGLDGLYFIGGAGTGRALHRSWAERPGRILALELGGNNPLVAWEVGDLERAVPVILQSAYLSAGQRCTCARRLVIEAGSRGDALVRALLRGLDRLRVGAARSQQEPFMGPVISSEAAEQLLGEQAVLLRAGAQALRMMKHLQPGTGLLSPGLLDATSIDPLADVERFGPLLLVRRVPDFAAALDEANATCYGLAAGLITDREALYEEFYHTVRAGIINCNAPLTGASGAAPFGGVGESGNHRPAGFFTVDYCAYPVATRVHPDLPSDAALPPGLDEG